MTSALSSKYGACNRVPTLLNTFIWRLLNFSNIGGKAKSAKIQVCQYSIFIPLHMHVFVEVQIKKENLMST